MSQMHEKLKDLMSQMHEKLKSVNCKYFVLVVCLHPVIQMVTHKSVKSSAYNLAMDWLTDCLVFNAVSAIFQPLLLQKYKILP